MTDSSDEIDSIVCAAVELESAEERDAYIRSRCAGDQLLQDRIESLVDGCLRAGDFLETPAAASATWAPDIEPFGSMIGPYKLLQQIGEGGMGVVFMAEQTQPVRRKVALKIIKPGMDNRKVIARFEAERQALAMMDHPNIAKVLDAGATDEGQPYFVMELVKGVPITQYCDERRFTTRQRLELFLHICQAVQHAHQKGIIHRDLKPSNVPVADYDDQPVPKIIDFGVAKAISQQLTEKTLFTELGQIIGTFEYMSPEQAKLNQLDIDTRTDIYSLGVLLYELLTGSTPLQKNRVRSAAFGEILRMIGEEEPPTPSTRLSSSDTLPAISAQRQTEPAKLTKLVRGDLDWIVMKCLQKERCRRYDTASALANDLQRYLNSQPIEARGPTRFYRLKKFIHRNKVGVLAAAAVTLAIVIGFTVSVLGFVHAKTEALRSRQTSRFLEDMLAAAGPRVARGRDATLLREILDHTAERIETELQDNPEIEGDVAIILGNTYYDIGQSKRAATMFERAVACYRSEPGGDNPKLAIALGELGSCQSFLTDVSAGRRNAALGLEMARRSGDRMALASCLSSMAYACNAHGLSSSEGITYLRECLALRRELGTDPIALAACMRRLGQTLGDAEGDQILQESLEIYRAERGDDDPGTISCLWAIGQRQLQRGELDKAEQTLDRTFEFYKKVYGPSYPFFGIVWRQLATALVAQGKWEAAEEVALPASQRQSGNVNQWDLLGKISAYRGDWPVAVERLNRARTAGDYWEVNRLAVALLAAGRRQEYRELCHELISSKHSSATVEMDGATAYLLLPTDEITLPIARQFSEAIVSVNEGRLVTTKKRVNKALALFRLGQFEQAIQTIEPPDVGAESMASHAECWAIRALSYAELQRPLEARKALESVHGLIARDDRRWRGDPLENVFNWQTAELLMKEAEAFLEVQKSEKTTSHLSAPARATISSVEDKSDADDAKQ